MADSGQYTPETIARKAKMAELLLGQSMKPEKIEHWAQGLAQLGRAGIGGYMAGEAEREQKEGDAKGREFIASLLGGGSPTNATGPQAAAPAPGGPMGDLPGMANSIASIESGGKYDALGPMTKGDRAYGKYQVMGANVPQWTKQHLGQEMTPEQFLQNPQAQDAVFKGQFGQYAQKYGPEGAARAWFAGEGGMNNPNAKDVLGTTVQGYADKFNKGMGNQVVAALGGGTPSGPPASAPPQQMAQAGPPQTAGNPMQARIVEALRSKDPYIARAAQSMAGPMLQRQMEGDKPTDEIREYNLYKAQGGNKTFFDYKADLKKAGAQNISIDQRGEVEFDKASGKHQAERFDKLVSGGMEAKAMRADLDALKDIGSRITTGKTAELTAALGPYAEAAGIKIDSLDDLQAYKSIVAKLAPRMRVVGSGATSDYEMRQFLEALPGLGKTPGGNEMIQTTLQALQDHKEQAAEIASKAMNKELTPREADKLLRQLPDPLTGWKQANKQSTLKAGGNAPSVDDLLKKYGK